MPGVWQGQPELPTGAMRPWVGESDRDRGFHAQRGCEVWREPNSLVTQTVKNPPAMQETWVRSLG